jgi:hypothetical protein
MAFLWIVPAKVEGTWRLGPDELALKQRFQMISGTLGTGGNVTQIINGRLRGEQISFSVGAAQYSGRVKGDAMVGTVRSGSAARRWSATRTRALAVR